MSRLSALIIACLLLAPAASAAPPVAEARPTGAPLQTVQDLHERPVGGGRGPPGSRPGVIVGSEGQVLTSVKHVSLDEGSEVRHGDNTLPARLVKAHAPLKFAVVAAPSGTYPAVPVRPDGVLGQWLIGVVKGRDKRETPKVAQAREAPEPFLDVDLALEPGSPLFDAQGRLVAVVVEQRGRRARAVLLSAVKTHLAATASAP